MARVRRFAFARPRLLTVVAPGATGAHIEVERFARLRGWPLAAGPADADVQVDVGELTGELAEAADVVAGQLSAPWVRVTCRRPASVADLLADVPRALARGGSSARTVAAPRELPMAERADDRDGLALDVLRIPLGPVLPQWPAGLRLSVDIQGDVVQDSDVACLGAAGAQPFWTPDRARVRALDRAARLLAVSGWSAATHWCQRLRDSAHDGAVGEPFDGEREKLARWVSGNRLLRLLLRGVGCTPDAGDAWDRLIGWLAGDAPAAPHSRDWLERLPGMVAGHELSDVRLIVASLDIDVAEAVARDG